MALHARVAGDRAGAGYEEDAEPPVGANKARSEVQIAGAIRPMYHEVSVMVRLRLAA